MMADQVPGAPDPAEVHALFLELCELPQRVQAQRLAELTDHTLRDEVAALLRADDEGGYLDETRLERLRSDSDCTATPLLPERIGSFRILDELGSGGMGVVYRAEQERPHREVALKVLNGHASAQAVRRFEFEAEALGQLQHPGIAQILEAGTYDSDRGALPYLAMEFIRGRSLREWAAETSPDQRTRIEVLIELCEAVHHAHQKGLVHRDLKPGNVLVDDDGRLKVLDFGIARLAGARPAGGETTLPGQVIGTLSYMSPEQVDGDPESVDIRADVYALGVLGYQLLSGALPIKLDTNAIAQSLRRLVEEEPTPMSAHGVQFRGDLQTIFGKALRKDPGDRYSSAMGLAEDLRRYLLNEPVAAREPSSAYLLSRFAKRHRVLLGAVALVILSLAAGLVVSISATRQAREAQAAEAEERRKADVARREESLARAEEAGARRAAERAAAEARRQTDVAQRVLFFLQQLLELTDPQSNPDALQLSTAQRFGQAVQRLEPQFADEPEVEKVVRTALVTTMLGLGLNDLALIEAQKAWQLPPDPEEPWTHVRAGHALVSARLATGDQAGAATLGRRLVGESEALLARAVANGVEPHERLAGEGLVLMLKVSLATALYRSGGQQDAMTVWDEVLSATPNLDSLTSNHRLARANALTGLAMHLVIENRLEEAKKRTAEGFAILAAELGPRHTATLNAQNTMAGVAASTGDLDKAAEIFSSIERAFARTLGEDHPDLILIRQNAAAAYFRTGQIDRARSMFEAIIRSAATEGGAESYQLAVVHANLGKLQWSSKELTEAEASYRRAIAIRARMSPHSDRALSGYHHDLARVLRDQNRKADAVYHDKESVRIRIEALGPYHELVLHRRILLADVLVDAGEFEEAESHFEDCASRVLETYGPKHYTAVLTPLRWAECRLHAGDQERARELLDQMLERIPKVGDPPYWRKREQAVRERLRD